MARPRVSLPKNSSSDPVKGSALALQPKSLAAFDDLYGTLWSRGVISHRCKEIARLRNARTTNCVFCRSVRFEKARQEGLTEAQVDLIDDDFENSDLPHKEKLVLRYTDVFLKDPHGLSTDIKTEMLEEFSAEEIVELTAALAIFMGFSKIAVSLGGMPDSLPVFTMPTPK